MYEVKIDTIAIMEDGHAGNISQGTRTVYTDAPLGCMEEQIDDVLKPEKMACIVKKVTQIKGMLVAFDRQD